MEAQSPQDHPEELRRGGETAPAAPAIARVREEDLEPHEGLRYIARLFKVLALLLALLLIAEVAVGLQQGGTAAIMPLLVEGTRILVFAGLLWAAGDLSVMFIESNHDLRASRILLGRLNGRLERMAAGEPPPQSRDDAPPFPPPVS